MARRVKTRSRKRARKSPENTRGTRGTAQTSLANLRRGAAFRWQPGQSGNPGGRPAFKELSNACREILLSPLPDDPKRTYAEAIAERLAQAALAGNIDAAAELGNRAEGRPRQALEISDGKPDPLAELIAEFNKEYELAEKEAARALEAEHAN
jgi:hypothetical protein